MTIGKYAYSAAAFAFLSLIAFWFIEVLIKRDSILSALSVAQLLDRLQTAVALLIVCIPEGLPLAVSMTLALSIDRLKSDNLLIKNLKSLE